MEKKKCPFCNKVIEGYKKNIEYMLNQHILSKHSDKIKIDNGPK